MKISLYLILIVLGLKSLSGGVKWWEPPLEPIPNSSGLMLNVEVSLLERIQSI